MAEPEDVLLELAERATAPLRARWLRGLREEGASAALDALRLELQVFLVAAFGRSWPAHALPPPRPRGALALLWRRALAAPVSFCDGRALYLTEPAGAPHAREELLCAALGLAARDVRGSLALVPVDPLARDLFWIADAAGAEAHVCAALPGLAAPFACCRARARAARRDAAGASPLERRVEAELRRALASPAASGSEPAACARLAETAARAWRAQHGSRSRYRGVAPAACWGAPAPIAAALSLEDAAGEAAALRRLPTHAMRAAPDASPAERGDARAAPLLIPPGDPHASVTPAGRRAPPRDQGDEDVDALAEELERLGRVERVRSSEPVREILASESGTGTAASGTRAAQPAGAARAYPEWDYRAQRYRRAHCIVHGAPAAEGDPTWVRDVRAAQRPLLRRLRRHAEQLRPRLERRRAELQGAEIDLDRCVEAHAEQRARGSAEERLYIDRRRRRRDLAVALLIDTSASTDRFVAPDRRVIDLEREAALLFCEAAAAVGDRHAVYAFSGTGAARVRVAELRSFAEREVDRVARRIAGLEPDAYTRIGGALRRVADDLARTPARRRLLLLLSDGWPNDADEYEGRYGVEDTRRAMAELRLLGIRPFCVAVDPRPGAPLARMFGRSGHTVLRDLRRLPEQLAIVYRQLARG